MGTVRDKFEEQHVDPESRTLAGIKTLYDYESTHLDRLFRSLQVFMDMTLLQQMTVVYDGSDEDVLAAAGLAATRLTDACVVDMRFNPLARDWIDARLGFGTTADQHFEVKVAGGVSMPDRLFCTWVDSGVVVADRGVQAFQEVVDYLYGRYSILLHAREKAALAARHGKRRQIYDSLHDVLHYTPLPREDHEAQLKENFMETLMVNPHGKDRAPERRLQGPIYYSWDDTKETRIRDYRNVLHRHIVESFPLYKTLNVEEQRHYLENCWVFWKMRDLWTDVRESVRAQFMHMMPWPSDAEGGIEHMFPWTWPALMTSPHTAQYVRRAYRRAESMIHASVTTEENTAQHRDAQQDRIYLFGGHHAAVVIECLTSLLKIEGGSATLTHWVVTPRWALNVTALRATTTALLGTDGPAQVADSLTWQLEQAPFVVAYDQRLGDVARKTTAQLEVTEISKPVDRVLLEALKETYYNTSEGIPTETDDYKNNIPVERILLPRGLPVYTPIFQLYRDTFIYGAKAHLVSVRALRPLQQTMDANEEYILFRMLNVLATLPFTAATAEQAVKEVRKTLAAPNDWEKKEGERLDAEVAQRRTRLRTIETKPAAHSALSVIYTGDPLPLALLDHERTSSLWLSFLLRPKPRVLHLPPKSSKRTKYHIRLQEEQIDVNSMFSSHDYYNALHVDVVYGESVVRDLMAFVWDYMKIVLKNDYIQHNPTLPKNLLTNLMSNPSVSAARKAHLYYLRSKPTVVQGLESLMYVDPASTLEGGLPTEAYEGTWIHAMFILFYQPRTAEQVQQLLQAPARKLALYMNQKVFPASTARERVILLTTWLIKHLHGSVDNLEDRYRAELDTFTAVVSRGMLSIFQSSLVHPYLRLAEYVVVRYTLGIILPILRSKTDMGLTVASAYVHHILDVQPYDIPVWVMTSRVAGHSSEWNLAHTVLPYFINTYADDFENQEQHKEKSSLSVEEGQLLGLDVQAAKKLGAADITWLPDFMSDTYVDDASVVSTASGSKVPYTLRLVAMRGPYLVSYARPVPLARVKGVSQSLLPAYDHLLYMDLAVATRKDEEVTKEAFGYIHVGRWRF